MRVGSERPGARRSAGWKPEGSPRPTEKVGCSGPPGVWVGVEVGSGVRGVRVDVTVGPGGVGVAVQAGTQGVTVGVGVGGALRVSDTAVTQVSAGNSGTRRIPLTHGGVPGGVVGAGVGL